jgi:heme-degrading monooxygenase HmoA
VIANTPAPPYYAVIFTSQRTDGGIGYEIVANEMMKLAAEQEGFLGAETARDEKGFGITVSYWSSLEAIKKWKEQPDHLRAQKAGREDFYKTFKVRVCKVER